MTTVRGPGEPRHRGRQDRVKANRSGVKEPSADPNRLTGERTLSQGRSPAASTEGQTAMADVAYLALTLGAFLLLVFTLRGLEKI